MPRAISTGVVSPGRHVGPADLFGEVVSELGPDPIFPPPFAPDRAAELLDAFLPDEAGDQLRGSAWLDDGPPVDFGSPPPPDRVGSLLPESFLVDLMSISSGGVSVTLCAHTWTRSAGL